MDRARYRLLDAAELMPSFPKSRRNQVAEARAANEWTRLMFAPDKPPQIVYAPEKPKRERKPPRYTLIPSEHQSQRAVISWWRLAHNSYGLPEFALFAVPNGGVRDAITGSRLKAEGVRPGIPDLMLAVKRGDYSGLVIEMKKIGNQTKAAQKEVLAYLNEAGYACDVCWTAEAAIATIKHYLTR